VDKYRHTLAVILLIYLFAAMLKVITIELLHNSFTGNMCCVVIGRADSVTTEKTAVSSRFVAFFILI